MAKTVAGNKTPPAENCGQNDGGTLRAVQIAAFRLEWATAVLSDERLGAPEARLGALIALRYVNNQTGIAWPSQAELANAMGVSDRAVRRALIDLEGFHYLDVEPGSGQRNSVYRLNGEGGRNRPRGRTKTSTGADKNVRRNIGINIGVNKSSDLKTTVSSNSEAQQPVTRKRRAPVARFPIPADWVPSPADVQVARNFGLTTDDIAIERAKFVRYFVGTGEARPGWSKSWGNWAQRVGRKKKGNAALRPSSDGTRMI